MRLHSALKQDLFMRYVYHAIAHSSDAAAGPDEWKNMKTSTSAILLPKQPTSAEGLIN